MLSVSKKNKEDAQDGEAKDLRQATEIRKPVFQQPPVLETRPKELDCDVVRFQNNKEKWVAFVGLVDGRPYEIFTGLQDDEEGIVLPKTVTKGKIIKQTNPDTPTATISSSRTGVDTRRPSRDCRRSSTRNTGTMRSSSRVCCAIGCRSAM